MPVLQVPAGKKGGGLEAFKGLGYFHFFLVLILVLRNGNSGV